MTHSAARQPTFAIAFGGGGARGLAHIHVIEMLDELGIRPVAIAGSSIGAIMGAGMAAGISGKDIRAHCRNVLGNPVEVINRIWKTRPASLGEAMEAGLRISQFNVERILKVFLPQAVPEHFQRLEIPLKVTATDFYGHELVVLEEGDLLSALAASAAIPAVFRPVRRDGRLLIDGGIYNPVPFDLLAGMSDIVIAIDVVGWPEEISGEDPGSVELMFGASQLLMQSIISTRLQTMQPDILLRPPVSRFRALEFLKVEAILEESAAIRESLKEAVTQAVEAWHDR